MRELVDTERKYVQDLENLHDLKKALEQRGVVPGDIVHQIFMNIKRHPRLSATIPHPG